MLKTGEYQERSRVLGDHMLGRLRAEAPSTVAEVRGRGLWAGVQLHPGQESARSRCERLMVDGVLAKDTHETTIRLAPPLVIDEGDLDLAIDKLLKVLH
jgi:ornithine--oxo-acid transaminase